MQSILAGIINELEPARAALPAGFFRGLTTAETGLTDALGGLGWGGVVRPLLPAEPRCAECGAELYGETEAARGVCADCAAGQ